jgi:hypothetical protein
MISYLSICHNISIFLPKICILNFLSIPLKDSNFKMLGKNKMKNENTTLSEQFQNLIGKSY